MVAPLPPGMAPNVEARFERDPGQVRKGLNGPLVRPMLGDESTGAAHAGVADRRRKESQGKLVVHAGRAAWNGIRRGRPARGG